MADATPGRVPPQNVDAEASLLGSILIDPNAITEIADTISPPDFYDERHKNIYEHMLKLYDGHRPIDLLTLSESLKSGGLLDQVGGSSYLTDLTNMVPTAAHLSHYKDIVEQKAVRRRLITAAQDITELSFGEETPTQELIAQSEARIFDVSQADLKQDLKSIESILTESFDRLDELHKDKSKLRGVSTGYRELDNILAGFQPSDLIVLAARPAMGKSTLAINIAHNVAVKEKKTVLVFSLEMSKEQLVDRMLASEAGVDAWNIRTGNLSDADFEKLGHAMGTLSEAPIFIDDTPLMSVHEMRTKARREQHRQQLGLIVVDYLQLMSASSFGGSDNRVQEISEISRGLKAIARELNVPVLALSQLSRSVESRSPQIPQLSDLRESGSIEQDADVVAFIYREDYYNPDTDRKHITDIFIKKHRNGPTGSVELYFHPERLQFLSIDRRRET
ncbi:MAG: replicative DNA helicase [Candidatus Saccharimonadales bacterium]|nr:replicative DNA helicase [Candidatus Saccharimonadales bacterium]